MLYKVIPSHSVLDYGVEYVGLSKLTNEAEANQYYRSTGVEPPGRRISLKLVDRIEQMQH